MITQEDIRMTKIKVRNATIDSACFDTERGLTAYVYLDYGNSGHQGFGGYLLYAPQDWAAYEGQANYAGHFIWRVLEVAGVSDWSKLAGKTVRVRAEHSKVHAIGHITKDNWFNPSEEFAKLRNRAGSLEEKAKQDE